MSRIAFERPSFPELQRIVAEWDADPAVAGMTWRGLLVWPVARVLFHSFAHAAEPSTWGERHAAVAAEPPPDLTAIANVAIEIGKAAGAVLEDAARRELPARLTPCDVLLVANSVNAYAEIDGRRFDPFLDSLALLLGDRYRFLKVEIVDGPAAGPGAIAPVVVDPEPFLSFAGRIERLDAQLSTAAGADAVLGFEQFRSLQIASLGREVISEGQMVERARRIELTSRLFKLIYRMARPRLVLVVDFANWVSAAACKAAADLGIPSADVQHGAAGSGRYNLKWTGWSGPPPQGYGLLPRFFWVWGERTRAAMAEGCPDGSHEPVVGGHPWLTLWKDARFARFRTALPPPLVERMELAGKRIVVSLPNDIDTAKLDMLEAALSAAPPDWLWLLRIHPTDRHAGIDPASVLLERTGRVGGANIETEHASRANLVALLERADVHVTDNSSSCLEALEFGVPTVIYGSLGRQVFADYIEEGVFATASDAEAFLAAIGGAKKPSQGFVVTDLGCAERALARMIAAGPGPHATNWWEQ